MRPRRQAFGYDVEYSLDSMGFLGQMIDILEDPGWNLHDVVAEGAYSQFELDFHYTDVLAMADRLVFLRVMLREIAKQHGMFVTFMPKPTTGDWRSGAHMNTSVRKTFTPDANLFENDGKWSDEVLHAVGGLLRHGGALTAVACSTVNSYNGLVPQVGGFEGGTVTWAPTHMTYVHNNRSAMLRLPQSRFCIENRAADMCMNPYLGLGISAAAMAEGIVNSYDPGKPLNQDLYSMTSEEIARSGAQRLPRNLLEAIEILRDDGLAKNVIGRDDAELLSAVQNRRVGALSSERHRLGSSGVPAPLLNRSPGDTRDAQRGEPEALGEVQQSRGQSRILARRAPRRGKPQVQRCAHVSLSERLSHSEYSRSPAFGKYSTKHAMRMG